MELKIGFSMLGRMFMLPASVVDEFLKISSGEHVKVLLCIYCLGKNTVDTGEVSRMAGVSEQAVKEAVIHFSKLGVISSEEIAAAAKPVSQTDSQSDIKNTESAADLKLIGGAEAIRGSKRDQSKASRVRFTPKELAAMIEQDEELKSLIGDMEKLIAKPLTHSNLGDVVEMYEHMELSPASILMIAEYCKGLGRTQTAYILRVAQDWFEEGISGFEQIERKIITMSEYHSFENRIKQVLGLIGSTTKKQREFFESWQLMGFDEAMIRLAYEENMDRKNSYSLSYMNKILTEWDKKGIRTPEQAAAEQQAHKEKAVSGSGINTKEYEEFAASIDFDKLSTE